MKNLVVEKIFEVYTIEINELMRSFDHSLFLLRYKEKCARDFRKIKNAEKCVNVRKTNKLKLFGE